jgi:hypothetical protein
MSAEEPREEKLQIAKEVVIQRNFTERTSKELLRQQAWDYFQMHAALFNPQARYIAGCYPALWENTATALVVG